MTIELRADDSRDLLEVLRNSQLPIASSCDGEGVCKKCDVLINKVEYLTCQINAKKLIQQLQFNDYNIEISYL